jgi:hypothetical protein
MTYRSEAGTGAAAASHVLEAAGFGGAEITISDKRLARKRRAARYYVTRDRLNFWRMCGAFAGDPQRHVLWQRMLLLSPRTAPVAA